MAAAAVGALLLAAASITTAPAAGAATCPTVDGDTGAVSPAPEPGADWRGCNLSNADLSNADLASANLRDVNFFNAGLYDVTLTGANLTGANLENASLTGSVVTCSDTGVLGTGVTGTPAALADGWTLVGGTLRVPVVACPRTPVAPTIPDWNQAYARAGADVGCLPGWRPSWAQWPGGGTGGFVCERAVPAFG